MENILQLIFPTVYGKSQQNDQIATQIFNLVIQFLKEDKTMFSKQKQKNHLLDLLTKAPQSLNQSSLKVIFKCEYGCAIIISKVKKQSPINMQMVAPKQWGSGANNWRAQKLQFWQPKNNILHFIEQIAENHISLQDFTYKFAYCFDSALSSIQEQQLKQTDGKQKNFSTKVIQKACKKAISSTNFVTSYTLSLLEQNSNKKNNVLVATSQSINLKQSKPNTSWYIPEAVITKLVQTSQKYKEFGKKLILFFKAYVLDKVTGSNLQYNQEKVQKLKKCLDEIILKYRKNISKQKSKLNRVDDFLKITKKINQNIKKITKNGLTSKIQDIPNSPIKFQEPSEVTFIKPEKLDHIEEEREKIIINDYPFYVKKRLPFETLLQLFEKTKIQNPIQSLIQKDKWILLTQRIFFNLSKEFANKDQIIDLQIHMREIQCEIGATNLVQVVSKYQQVVKSDEMHFGMGMKGQARSHIQLIKSIASIITFQLVKMNRENMKSNLNKYRIPLDIDVFYNAFISHSYEARKAIKNLLIYYQYRKQKQPIFIMNGKMNTFCEYARVVAQQTRSAYVWKNNMQRICLMNKQKLVDKMQKKFIQQKLNKAFYYLQNFQNGFSNQYYTNLVNSYSKDYDQKDILLEYDQSDPWLFAFLQNIPKDILGLIKVLMQAQNPSKNEDQMKNNIFKDHFLNEKHPVKPYSKTPLIDNHTYSSNNLSVDNVHVQQKFNDCSLTFQKSHKGVQMTQQSFQIYRKLISKDQQIQNSYQSLSYLLKPAKDSKFDRQHKLYAKQSQKPKQIQIQDFIAIGNIRSAEKTQLMVLCLNILQKKAISDSYNIKCLLPEEVILQTAGQLSTYDSKIQKQFGFIKKLLYEFENVWAFTDVNFCPILAPMLGYFSRQLEDDKLISKQQFNQIKKKIVKLCQKCLNQFKRGQEQQKNNPKLKIQWDQRFIITAAIFFFRQLILTQEDTQQLQILCELIFQLRQCKILSDREQKPKNKRQFQQQLLFSVQKAVFYNIQQISKLLSKNNSIITKIIKKVDADCPDNIDWKRQNTFSFVGKTLNKTDQYQVDLFSGKIYKNRKQVSALDKCIKQNHYFKQIFGEDRQFKVFKSRYDNYLRTTDHVNHQFKIPLEKGKILFEFSIDGKQIRHIFKKQNEKQQEDIWTLLPKQILMKSDCYFPQIFLDHYHAWYSQMRSCIVFRRTSFDQIYNIGFVIHLTDKGKKLQLIKAFHVTYHGSFQDQDLDEICNIQSKRYDQIILRSKSKKLQELQTFKVFSKFQNPKFIFELKNRKSKQIQYLLHRYQIKFQISKSALISQTYFGYSLDYSFYDHQNCLFNKFQCLILKKDSKSSTLLNNHNRIVIISDGKVKRQGKIKKISESHLHIESFKYQIHDFFGDLRGSTRQSLIQLSSIMLSINDNIKISSIQMTPMNYSAYLLNSCLSNRSLTQKQLNKIQNLMRNLNPSESIALLCEALWKCSKSLQNILPFPQEKQILYFSIYQQNLKTCKTLYWERYKENSLMYRQRINNDLLNFLGIQVTESCHLKQQESSSSSDSQSQSNDKNGFWRKVPKYTGQNINEKINEIQSQFQQFEKKVNLLNIWDQKQQIINQSKPILPKQISQLSQKQNCNIMMKQMIQQLKQSYNTFIHEQKRIQRIKSKLGEKELQNQLILAEKLQQKALNSLKKIQKLFQQIKQLNQDHPDLITGIIPTFSFICFTKILCNPNEIYSFFPDLTKKAEQNLKKIIQYWIELRTRLSSLQRVIILLNSSTLDVVSLMRQIQSPRKQVRQKKYWMCFQAELKVQLWASQMDTFNNLMKSQQSGSFCQLNMGQGKTQVIIPMIILEIIYQKKGQLPRINILTSLMQEARGNFFRFLSVTGFQIPGFQIPFKRSVQLNKKNICVIQNIMGSFSNKLYVLMSRQSRLSQILKFYETNKTNQQISIQNTPLIPCKIFDIFDEIDALMTSVKSYIYSIKSKKQVSSSIQNASIQIDSLEGTIQLPSAKVRLESLRILIEIFLRKHLKFALKQKIATTEQTDQDALKLIEEGHYPPGLRLNLQNADQNVIQQFRRILVKDVIKDPNNNYFSFTKHLTQQEIEDLISFIVNPLDELFQMPTNIAHSSRDPILMMRGAIGYGIFQHCLSMRCGVDYGVPNNFHQKKIAVPYEAADIPSKTSQYQQPDVSAILSYLAYYTKGLNQQQFDQALKGLLSLSNTSKQLQYKEWYDLLCSNQKSQLKVKNATQINYNSKALRDDLYSFYKFNRRTIAFWLNKFVFPTNLRQYKRSICASAWDLADVEKSIGFSGTKDNHWLYSDKLKWKPCLSPPIKGTDGKMLYLISNNTNKILLIEENEKSQWQRFVDLALKQKVGCIIDAGALCVGKSLQRQIVPWIAQHQDFDHDKYAGISFCDQNGIWKVYQIQSKIKVARRTTIPDHQTFVIFDEARTRGADLKMNEDVIAAISLGPRMTKDKFMQAAGRLRRLGRSQKLIIMANHQIFSSFPNFPKQTCEIKQKINKLSSEQLSNIILSWCCKNSVQSNENLLVQFGNLGWCHLRSKVDKRVYEKDSSTELADMYGGFLQRITVQNLNQRRISQLPQGVTQHPSGKQIIRILKTYGKNVYKQAGSLDDVCERQVQPEKPLQKQLQNQLKSLDSIQQKEEPKVLNKLPQIPIQFDQKFKMTQNFVQTTRDHQEGFQNTKQLGQVYFALINQNQIKIITLREASKHINEHIVQDKKSEYRIVMLDSLSVEDQFIKSNKLQGALVSAKLLAGIQNYSLEQQKYLLKIFLKSIKNRKQWGQKIQSLTQSILRKKRTFLKKYMGSTLQKIVIKLSSQGIYQKELVTI